MYNKYCNTVLMNNWHITHTHRLLKRSLMRSHPVSGNSGLRRCCGKVCTEVLSEACTQGRVNPRRALRGPRCEPPGPFASVPPHKSWFLAVHINKLLNQWMRETRPEVWDCVYALSSTLWHACPMVRWQRIMQPGCILTPEATRLSKRQLHHRGIKGLLLGYCDIIFCKMLKVCWICKQ